jgi:hypothetical protein
MTVDEREPTTRENYRWVALTNTAAISSRASSRARSTMG